MRGGKTLPFFTYILASRPGGAIYVGATEDLRARVEQHRARSVPGHTAKYGIATLVWFELHATRDEARTREARIKRWPRAWKDALIAEANPDWRDRCEDIPL